MSKFKTRDELRNSLIKQFSQQKEVFKIFFFGKEVENKHDQFSDIDMIVCSSDLAKTQSNYRNIISNISPIIGTLWLESSKKTFAESIMLKDYAPYQKIDLSITNDIANKIVGETLLVYEDENKSTLNSSELKIIEKNPVRNQLHDYLFSVPRFTKCLFRKDFDMYRRWKGVTNIVPILLYEKHFGWQRESCKKLMPQDFVLLYKNLSSDEKTKLEEVYPLNAELNIAKSFNKGVDLLIELSKLKAENFKIDIDENFIEYIKEFLNSEVKRFTEN
jgi:predicted nucleotidyltransferase